MREKERRDGVEGVGQGKMLALIIDVPAAITRVARGRILVVVGVAWRARTCIYVRVCVCVCVCVTEGRRGAAPSGQSAFN